MDQEYIESHFRTNFFDFGDKDLIRKISNEHHVRVTSNMKGIALVSNDLDELISAIKESFNNDCYINIENDIIYVNLKK